MGKEEKFEGPVSSHTEYVITVLNSPLDAPATHTLHSLALICGSCDLKFQFWLSLLRTSYEFENMLHFDESISPLIS